MHAFLAIRKKKTNKKVLGERGRSDRSPSGFAAMLGPLGAERGRPKAAPESVPSAVGVSGRPGRGRRSPRPAARTPIPLGLLAVPRRRGLAPLDPLRLTVGGSRGPRTPPPPGAGARSAHRRVGSQTSPPGLDRGRPSEPLKGGSLQAAPGGGPSAVQEAPRGTGLPCARLGRGKDDLPLPPPLPRIRVALWGCADRAPGPWVLAPGAAA